METVIMTMTVWVDLSARLRAVEAVALTARMTAVNFLKSPRLLLLLQDLLKKGYQSAVVETTAVRPITGAGWGMETVIMTMTVCLVLSARLRAVTDPPLVALTALMTVANFLKNPRQALDPQ